MAKYGPRTKKTVERVMHERKHGTLRSGASGRKVTSRKQAVAIALSEARREGDKVPSRQRSRSSSRKSSGSRKTSSRRRTANRGANSTANASSRRSKRTSRSRSSRKSR